MWTTYKTNPVPQAHKKSTAAVAADVKKPILAACDEVKVHIVWSSADVPVPHGNLSHGVQVSESSCLLLNMGRVYTVEYGL